MPTKQFPHYVGTRLTEPEMVALQNLAEFVGRKQSELLRFLIRTAAQRPQQVALAMEREQAARTMPAHETTE
jgi:hypothetical protein